MKKTIVDETYWFNIIQRGQGKQTKEKPFTTKTDNSTEQQQKDVRTSIKNVISNRKVPSYAAILETTSDWTDCAQQQQQHPKERYRSTVVEKTFNNWRKWTSNVVLNCNWSPEPESIVPTPEHPDDIKSVLSATTSSSATTASSFRYLDKETAMSQRSVLSSSSSSSTLPNLPSYSLKTANNIQPKCLTCAMSFLHKKYSKKSSCHQGTASSSMNEKLKIPSMIPSPSIVTATVRSSSLTTNNVSMVFVSGTPTAITVARQPKQQISSLKHFSFTNKDHHHHHHQQHPHHHNYSNRHHFYVRYSKRLFDEQTVNWDFDPIIPPPLSYTNKQQINVLVPVFNQMKLHREHCDPRVYETSNLINLIADRASTKCKKLTSLASSSSSSSLKSTVTTTKSSKPKRTNLINLFLIITMLINLTSIVHGHNVNLNINTSSDRIVPVHQEHQYAQHQQQPYHQHNANNINREATRFSNFGNSFANADTVAADVDGRRGGYIGGDDDGFDVINDRDNNNRRTNDHHHHHNHQAAAQHTDSTSSASFMRSGCHSCQLREKVKADNLASIKRHILYRLKLTDVPNITAPVVPPEIVEKFYKSHYQNNGGGERGGGGSASGDHGGGSGGRGYSSTFYDNMQGDDPRAYYDSSYDGSDTSDSFGNRQYTDFDDSSGGNDDDYEEDFFSVVNSIYVFPTTQHTRHNRKSDILHFSLTNNGHSTVSQATLHIFVRSWAWVREHFDVTFHPGPGETDSQSSSSSSASSSISSTASSQQGQNTVPSSSSSGSNRNLDIILKINCVQRHANITTHMMHKGTEVRHRVPRNDNGIWITVDVTDMVTDWYNNASTNHGVLIKTKESWMNQFVVLDDSMANKTYAPYIEVLTKDNRKRRSKRNTSLNCSESDHETRCCRYPLEVNFRHFNWEWIIAPESFNAYFCNGECKLGFLPKYPHTHLMQMSTAPQPCCSPTKMSPVSLLYFSNEHRLVLGTIPNMKVDKCSCS